MSFLPLKRERHRCERGIEKREVDVALRDKVGGHSGDGSMIGLDDLRGIFKP